MIIIFSGASDLLKCSSSAVQRLPTTYITHFYFNKTEHINNISCSDRYKKPFIVNLHTADIVFLIDKIIHHCRVNTEICHLLFFLRTTDKKPIVENKWVMKRS